MPVVTVKFEDDGVETAVFSKRRLKLGEKGKFRYKNHGRFWGTVIAIDEFESIENKDLDNTSVDDKEKYLLEKSNDNEHYFQEECNEKGDGLQEEEEIKDKEDFQEESNEKEDGDLREESNEREKFFHINKMLTEKEFNSQESIEGEVVSQNKIQNDRSDIAFSPPDQECIRKLLQALDATEETSYVSDNLNIVEPTFSFEMCDFLTEEDHLMQESLQNVENTMQPSTETTPTETLETNNEERIEESCSSSCLTKKFHYCVFCGQRIGKLSSHLRFNHLNKEEVKRLHQEVNPKIKKAMYQSLTRKGDYARFQLMTSLGVDERLPVRINKLKKTQSLKICLYCEGFFSPKLLPKHVRKCPNRVNKNPKTRLNHNCIKESNILIASAKINSSMKDDRGFIDRIFGPMRDDFREICLDDPAIVEVAHLLYQPAKPRTDYHLRYKIRLLAKLKIRLNDLNTDGKTLHLSDFMHPEYFDAVCQVVTYFSTLTSEKSSVGQPSVAISYGEILNELLCSLIGRSIKQGDEGERHKKQFLDMKMLFDMQWKKIITKEARFAMKVNKNDKEDLLPLTEDIQIFNKALNEEVELAAEALQQKKNVENWKNLEYALLVKITVFNSRRPLEPGLITQTHFDRRIAGRDQERMDFITSLSESEKIISASMNIVKVVGKHGRIVPVLLTENCVQKIILLNNTRYQCDMDMFNPYVFPDGPVKSLHATKATRKLVNHIHRKYGLKRPELITAKQFRRVLGTYCQFLNLKDHEIEMLCTHLGHDFRTHLQYYRLQSNAAELAKVAKILMVMDEGDLAKHAGKTLDEIEIGISNEAENQMDDIVVAGPSGVQQDEPERSLPCFKTPEKKTQHQSGSEYFPSSSEKSPCKRTPKGKKFQSPSRLRKTMKRKVKWTPKSTKLVAERFFSHNEARVPTIKSIIEFQDTTDSEQLKSCNPKRIKDLCYKISKEFESTY